MFVLYLVVVLGYLEVCKVFLNYVEKFWFFDYFDMIVLDYVLCNGNWDIVRFLLENGNGDYVVVSILWMVLIVVMG